VKFSDINQPKFTDINQDQSDVFCKRQGRTHLAGTLFKYSCAADTVSVYFSDQQLPCLLVSMCAKLFNIAQGQKK